MPPVAVGAFHHHDIGAARGFRVEQDRRVVLADVAAEHEPAVRAAGDRVELFERRGGLGAREQRVGIAVGATTAVLRLPVP
jgi:hypothetical protein